jgi:carboxyl-terminal processing protease
MRRLAGPERRPLRPLHVVLAALLLVLALLAAFVAGYTLHGTSSSTPAAGPGGLEALVLTELEAHYYKPIDAARLESTGVAATLAALHDPYTVYLTPAQNSALIQSLSGTYSGVGAEFAARGGALVVTRVFAGSPALAAGIRAGDTVASVGGRPVKGESAEAAAALIRGAAGTRVTLGVQAAGSTTVRSVTMIRRQIAAPETATRLLHSHGLTVGYIALPSFSVGAGAAVRRDVVALQARGARAFVLDLRDDLGGYIGVAQDVASDFLAGGVVVSTSGLHDPRRVYRASGHPATSLPLVVLVDHWSASASEITAGALQDHDRATIIGQRTYGKGVAQANFTLPGGAALHMTIAGYLTPDGRDINHKGITPTVAVVDDPRTARDEALDRALLYLASGH